jgi:hypothetical protein
VRFVIPTVEAAESEPAAAVVDEDESEENESLSGLPNLRRRSRRFAGLEEEVGSSEEEGLGEVPDLSGGGKSTAFNPSGDEQRLVHIECPNGHELITPFDTMGSDVLCPYCGEQFTLNYSDTAEYQRELALKIEAEQQKLGKRWFTWAIIAGVFVLGMLIFMMIYTSQMTK